MIDLPRGGPTEREVLDRARAHDLGVEGLNSQGYTHDDQPDRQAIIVGYATPPERSFTATIRQLIDSLDEAYRSSADIARATTPRE